MKDHIKGGLSDGLSISDIADKHEVNLPKLIKELAKGVKVEMEHTSNKTIANEIARDHLFEDPKYYTKLEKLKL